LTVVAAGLDLLNLVHVDYLVVAEVGVVRKDGQLKEMLLLDRLTSLKRLKINGESGRRLNKLEARAALVVRFLGFGARKIFRINSEYFFFPNF